MILKCTNGTQSKCDENKIKALMNEYAVAVKNVFEAVYQKNNKIFFSKNIIGEYAELLVCNSLNLEKETASKPDYDAKKDGKYYQIKSRWINSFGSKNGNNQFGKISQKVVDEVHYLILVVFLGDTLDNYKIYSLNLKNDFARLEAHVFRKGQIIQKPDKDGYRKIMYYKDSFDEAVNKLNLLEEK